MPIYDGWLNHFDKWKTYTSQGFEKLGTHAIQKGRNCTQGVKHLASRLFAHDHPPPQPLQESLQEKRVTLRDSRQEALSPEIMSTFPESTTPTTTTISTPTSPLSSSDGEKVRGLSPKARGETYPRSGDNKTRTVQEAAWSMYQKYLERKSRDAPQLELEDYESIVQTSLDKLSGAAWEEGLEEETHNTGYVSFVLKAVNEERFYVAAQWKRREGPAAPSLRFHLLPLGALQNPDHPQVIAQGATGHVVKAMKHTGTASAAKVSQGKYPLEKVSSSEGFKWDIRFFEHTKGSDLPHVQQGPKSRSLATHHAEDSEGDVQVIEIFFEKYYPGGDAATRLEQGMELGEKFTLLNHLGQALESIHRLEIVHGDLKLENLVRDDEGNWHLVDFGSSFGPADKYQVGTQAYMTTDSVSLYKSQRPPDRIIAEYVSYGLLAYQLFTNADQEKYPPIGTQQTQDSPRFLPHNLQDHQGLADMAKALDAELGEGKGEEIRQAIITLVAGDRSAPEYRSLASKKKAVQVLSQIP